MGDFKKIHMKKLSKPKLYILFIAYLIGGIVACLLTNFGMRTYGGVSKFAAIILFTAAIGIIFTFLISFLYKKISKRRGE